MSDVIATSFGVLNYDGMLFRKGNVKTPFSSMIAGRMKYTYHVEFVTGQDYSVGGGSQPAISETASLTAPDATVTTRTQHTNVTQIFQKSVYVSYGKMSNMGTLSGLNVSNQRANPMSELDFQVAVKAQEIANDIEYTFINGAYQKAANDATANKTRGMATAITTNVIAMSSKPLGLWDVAEAIKEIGEQGADTEDLVLWVDMVTRFQLNADAINNGLTIVPAAREINGINVDKLVTPAGAIYIRDGKYLATGVALVVNPMVVAPVYQPTPGHGNFFLEELAKTGAGSKYQLFGQIGLDHGPEWCHAKFTGIADTFTAPTYSKRVYIDGGTLTTEANAG